MKYTTPAYFAFVFSGIFATGSVMAGMNVEHSRHCKNVVMTETNEFMELPMAAISLSDHHDGVKWVINWDGQFAKGVCIYKHGEFKGLKIKKHLKHHGKHQGSQDYQGSYGGFYYDRHIAKWRDPDGKVCHSCTPENGFPRNGG